MSSSKSIDPGSHIVVALDYPDVDSCLSFVDRISPDMCRLKIGKEMFTRFGPSIVERVQSKGFDVFLDLKFHDIPNTVSKALESAASLGVWMVNVHASGGERMLEASANAFANAQSKPLLIAVTVLTSMSQDELPGIGLDTTPKAQVEKLARLSFQAGLDGVVCSAHEAAHIKQVCSPSFLTVTPGIRPAGAALGDQRRVMTPIEAIQSGSDYLVIGRPITQADEPSAVLNLIAEELATA